MNTKKGTQLFAGADPTRRAFLGHAYTALAGVGLTHLLSGELAADDVSAWRPGRDQTHHPARAKRVLQIFCPGAASHMDLWEHKPSLEKYHGQPLPGEENFVSFQGKNGNLMKSPWPFVPAGESGKMISSMLPHMSRHADDIAFLHALHNRSNTHGPGCIFMNTGHPTEGFPAAGAWTSYALGSANGDVFTVGTAYTVDGAAFGEADKTVAFPYGAVRGGVSEGRPSVVNVSGTSYAYRPTLS